MTRIRSLDRRLTIALSLLGFVLVAAFAITWRADQVLKEFEVEAKHQVERLQTDIDNAVHAGTEDLVFLAESPEARAAAAGSPQAIAELEALLLAYVQARSRVFQARLLGPSGQELLRIERGSDKSPTRATRLQDKAKRYYFAQATALKRGEVLVSELDLNVENGKVENPLKPTLRFATPLLDDQERLAGVIVVNRAGQDLIDLVKRSRRHIPGDLMLIDSQGYYLSHPDKQKEWGGPNMLDSGMRLSEDHPGVSAWYSDQPNRHTFRSTELVAARASAQPVAKGPQVLLITPIRAALAHRAREFVPLGLGLLAAGLILIAQLSSLRRQKELTEQVERESILREQITSREKNLREAQDRLVASARLAALTESAAALAHELRNPLGAIINSVSLLRADNAMGESDRALLAVVLSESQRLERAVSEFLDLSRRPRRRIERFDLNDTVRQILTLAKQDLGAETNLTMQLGPEPLNLDADPDEVRQILWNLLLNARTANRRGGGRTISVSTAGRTRGEKPGVLLVVLDEGPGLSSEPKETPDRSSPGGAGLGLIVVAGITAHYSGNFEIRDRPDSRGASAQVWLPFSATETPWQPS